MQRRLAAILAADMVGYSRLMSTDEAGTLTRQKALRASLIDPAIARQGGRIVKSTGDGLLVEFGSVVGAVTCALEVLRSTAEREDAEPEERRIRYRIGVNLGEIVIDEDDIFGDGVNIAARLEALAPPGGLCISDSVHENLRTGLDATFEDLGRQNLKNIARPLRVWRWSPSGTPDAADSSVARRPPAEERGSDDRPSIAVLPFVGMSSAAEAEHLGEGIAEELTTALSKLDSLNVISRTTAFAFKDKVLMATQVAQQIGADYVLEGSVQVAGQRVRIHAQLIEARDKGGHLWAERFDGRLAEVFELQDEISQKVVAALEVRFSEGEQVRLWRAESGSPKAYELFLRGRANYKAYTRVGHSLAKADFQAALAITPGFHSATVALARCHIDDATFGWAADRAESLAEASRLLRRVLDGCDSHAGAHVELAHHHYIAGDPAGALREVERGVALDPTSADARNVMAWVLLSLSRAAEALSCARHALSLNPGTPEFYILVMADALVALGRYDEAMPLLNRVLARRPGWISARALRAICEGSLGRDLDARDSVARILERSPRFSVSRWRAMQHNPERSDVAVSAGKLAAAGLPP